MSNKILNRTDTFFSTQLVVSASFDLWSFQDLTSEGHLTVHLVADKVTLSMGLALILLHLFMNAIKHRNEKFMCVLLFITCKVRSMLPPTVMKNSSTMNITQDSQRYRAAYKLLSYLHIHHLSVSALQRFSSLDPPLA